MKILLAIIAVMVFIVACNKKPEDHKTMYFNNSKAEKLLEKAINNDDENGISIAINEGADPNLQGLHGTTPLIMAVGKLKKNAVKELLKQGAKPDIRDVEKNNAVTLAISAYKKEPLLLEIILKAGGNPNTLFADNDPIITYFLSDYNFDAVRLLHKAGANINARTRSKRFLVRSYALSEDWDVVWVLLELGAKYDHSNETFSWQELFSKPNVHAPDSPLWSYKVKVWKFLKSKGESVPAEINDLVGQKYWGYLEKKGLPKPMLE